MTRTKKSALAGTAVHALVLIVAGGAGWLAGQRSAANRSIASPELSRSHLAENVDAPTPPSRVPEGWARTTFPAFTDPDISKESDLVQRAAANPETVMAEVMARPAGAERNAEIVELLRGWVTRDPLAAAEWLSNLDPRETPEMPFADVEPVFAAAPAEARAKGLLGFLAAKAEGRILLDAAEGRSEADVNRAFADRKRRESLSDSIIIQGGANPFVGESLNDLIRGDERVSTFGSQLNARAQALAAWASQEPEKALAWVRARPEAEARSWLMNTLVGALASGGAADQAIALYNSEPDTHERGALRSLGKAWAVADPTAALAWSDSIADASVRDQFITASLSECPAGQAPELLEFTSRITDPARRRQAREHLLAEAVWHQAAAREWLESDTSLDESERAHLQAYFDSFLDGSHGRRGNRNGTRGR